MLKFNFHLN